jgi:hypothetical protein
MSLLHCQQRNALRCHYCCVTVRSVEDMCDSNSPSARTLTLVKTQAMIHQSAHTLTTVTSSSSHFQNPDIKASLVLLGCMYVYICIRLCMYMCVRTGMYVCMCMYVPVCMYVCVCTFRYVCMYVCMNVSMYVCIYVCIYVCMYASIYY